MWVGLVSFTHYRVEHLSKIAQACCWMGIIWELCGSKFDWALAFSFGTTSTTFSYTEYINVFYFEEFGFCCNFQILHVSDCFTLQIIEYSWPVIHHRWIVCKLDCKFCSFINSPFPFIDPLVFLHVHGVDNFFDMKLLFINYCDTIFQRSGMNPVYI